MAIKSQIPRQTSIDIIYQLIAGIFRLSIIKVLTLQPKPKLQIRKQEKQRKNDKESKAVAELQKLMANIKD